MLDNFRRKEPNEEQRACGLRFWNVFVFADAHACWRATAAHEWVERVGVYRQKAFDVSCTFFHIADHSGGQKGG